MQITNIRVQHLATPMGFAMETPVISWNVEEARGKRQETARVAVFRGGETVFEAEGPDLSQLGVEAKMELAPRTRYDVSVAVWDDAGDTAEGRSWFETGKRGEPWQAAWIAAPFAKDVHPVLTRRFRLEAKPVQARLYGAGLGLYEVEVNGRKAGTEVLAPFYNDYEHWIQSQTYDVTDLMRQGDNEIAVRLGKGWYKGRLGWDLSENKRDVFGDTMQLLLEGRVLLETGEEILVATGDGQWLCKRGQTMDSSIYDGEHIDATFDGGEWESAVPAEAPQGKVMDRLSPPVRIVERLAGARLLLTPKGERVLDFGQVMTGWVEFVCDAPRGTKVFLQYGELLQDGCFYRENLRTAKAEFSYISSGERAMVRPRFTFYGFRYVKVEGLEYVNPRTFTACVIHSDLPFTGRLETGNAKLDRLIENALWSQRGNFLDVPTDCPQRDERMGWTGDAQVFAPTACYNMYTPAFYRKFLHDMLFEQRALDGCVPYVVPDVLDIFSRRDGGSPFHQTGSCAWGDAAAVIPWTVYRFYGDKSLLAEQYANMTLWADWIHAQDDGDFLWRKGFHFADWLALDNPDKSSSLGGTDQYYVASAYYFYSTLLCAKAAAVLGKQEDEKKYSDRAEAIRSAIRAEYFTPTGRIAVPTQTALALAIAFDFAAPEHRERLAHDLREKLVAKKVHLDTGFVGTYFLLPALTKAGMNDLAVQLLLNEDFPSWLYEVNMGATTIWERWNSVLPDGHVSDTGMNSMNHYAYGSVVEWIYATLCGLRPVEEAPGFAKAVIEPHTDPRLSGMRCEYLSAMGRWRAGWERRAGKIYYHVEVPFGAEAQFIPEDKKAPLTVNGKKTKGAQKLAAGVYDIRCSEKDVRTEYYRPEEKRGY